MSQRPNDAEPLDLPAYLAWLWQLIHVWIFVVSVTLNIVFVLLLLGF
ncbi:hypothetical protein EKD04_024000 [Chloroflexales bacterium ZM16-3]|nr:hypothetical protein [Chloroflexales bacterium ZM16-3]